PCRSILTYPSPGYLSAITISSEADPCPLRRGKWSTHKTIVDNQRGGNVYDVEVSIESLAKAIQFHGSGPPDTRTVHLERVIGPNSQIPVDRQIREHPVNRIATDEIETVVVLYDATQRRGSTNTQPPETRSIRYTLSIK